MAVILVVDDEIGIRELLSEILSDEGYGVLLAENASAARSAMTQHPDLVLLDIWMPDNDGVSLLKEWNATGQLNVPVIMMSGHATLDTAVEATKFGAVDFLEKPIALSRLISSVKEALAKSPREPKIGTAARPQYNRVEPAPIRSQAPIRRLPRRFNHRINREAHLPPSFLTKWIFVPLLERQETNSNAFIS